MSLAPFLPSHLVRSLAQDGPPARLPHAQRLEAALLFSDISGFTAMTERLQARGPEGAEEITAVEALARLQARATAGTILVSRAAAAAHRAGARTLAARRARPAPEAVLAPYVPAHVRGLQGRFDGEFRRAAMVFLETRGRGLQ